MKDEPPTKLSHLLTFLQSRLSCERSGLCFDWVHWAASIWVGPDKRGPPLCFPLSFYCTLKMNRGRVFTRAIRSWEHSQRSNRAAGLMATVGFDRSPPESWISASRPSFFHKALQSLPRPQMFVNTNVACCGQMIYFPPFASVGLSLRR